MPIYKHHAKGGITDGNSQIHQRNLGTSARDLSGHRSLQAATPQTLFRPVPHTKHMRQVWFLPTPLRSCNYAVHRRRHEHTRAQDLLCF